MLAEQFDVTECARLEFDFVCLSNYISFNFCFGSEEYPNYVCTDMNDCFAFFCTGPDPETGEEVMRNIAVIPGTVSDENPEGIMVQINTVNDGKSHGTAEDCILDYADYFVPNYFSYSIGAIDGIQYDGYTNKMSAEATLVPCEVYHMVISICDVGDQAFNSGVFIEGNSFDAPSAAIGLSRPDVGVVSGSCPFKIPLSLQGTGFTDGTIHFSFGGSAVPGVDFTLVDDEGNDAIANGFQIDETKRNLYIQTKEGVDLTNDKTIEMYLATSLCANFPQLLVYDTQRFKITKGSDVKVGDTILKAQHICFEVEAPLIYGSDPITYRWEPTTGIDNPYVRKSTAMITENRTYKLYATGGTGCNTSVATVQVQVNDNNGEYVGIEDVLDNGATVVAVDAAILVSGEGLQRVEVYNVDGRLMADRNCEGAQQLNLDMSAFGAGVYGVRVSTARGVSAAKVVVSK